MNGYIFPRTYADLDAAPWCHSYERPSKDAGDFGWDCYIHVYSDWFPDDYGERQSSIGHTLKGALSDLRQLWDNYMRPPAEAKP
jgi:hypothetical protein